MKLLIPGDPKLQNIFCRKDAIHQGSSFDLTIEEIIDHDGVITKGPYVLKPGHMVHVYSQQNFCLPNNITGHVTYKTTLTKKGVWALTVGIVDPGWNSPISTTLLNFSRADYPIAQGDSFLRVTFFEHDPVAADKLRKHSDKESYVTNLRKDASSLFPPTFLNSKSISQTAAEFVLSKFRNEALAWVALIVFVITVADVIGNKITHSTSPQADAGRVQIEALERKVDALREKIDGAKP